MNKLFQIFSTSQHHHHSHYHRSSTSLTSSHQELRAYQTAALFALLGSVSKQCPHPRQRTRTLYTKTLFCTQSEHQASKQRVDLSEGRYTHPCTACIWSSIHHFEDIASHWMPR
eukprot:GHVN01064778.1.p1 GENE.GHVN01064778.1~~GHVN01064778.1.p1  ORF type:complete len:114 (-),score=17.35 GHVN01064778.1:615-956(-)